MTIKLAAKHEPEEIMMRDVYVNTLIDLAAQDNRIIVLNADMMKSVGMTAFQEKYPDRAFNCGVQEANMIGIAAGLSATGKKPFAYSFATFATRRCYDQIFLSAAYAGLNVNITGSDPGITAAFNGGTHMAFEDVALMRAIPGAIVVDPADSTCLEALLRLISERHSVSYLRLYRREAVKIYETGSTFEIGKAITLRRGKDVTIIASGIMVAEALKAADLLAARGIEAGVVDCFTIKPLDRETVLDCAAGSRAIVTAENHNVIGGLGSAVAELLSENLPTPLARVGRQDQFGEVGPMEYLQEAFGLTARHIAGKAVELLG
jgi:transketolase